MSRIEIAEELEYFIRSRFQISADDSFFRRDINLWQEGYVDSLGITEVIAFLESRFKVRKPPDMLFDPDFVCIDGIARLTCGLNSAVAASA